MAVNRDKLKALPGDKLAELIKTDELELLFLHLQSMRNFSAMVQRLGGQQQPAPAAAPPIAPEPETKSDKKSKK